MAANAWRARQAQAQTKASVQGLTPRAEHADLPMTIYRGVAISWYRIEDQGSVRYATRWERGNRLHQGPPRTSLARALDAAYRLIDQLLADRPAGT
jgi:hypothetical protein